MSRKLKIGSIVVGILLIGLLFWWFVGRKSEKDIHLRAVPKNAAAVLKISLSQLISKADPLKLLAQSGLKNNKLLKAAIDVSSSGVDASENIYGFMVKENEENFAALVLRLDDADKFYSFLESSFPHDGPTSGGAFHYMRLSNSTGIGFNDDIAVILATDGDHVEEYIGKYLEQESFQSISTDENFKKFAAKEFDAGIFCNNKELSKLNDYTSSLSTLGIDNGYGELVLTFEKEKVRATYHNFPPADIFSVFKTNGPPAQHFEALSAKEPILFASAAVNLEGLIKMLKDDASTGESITGLEKELNLDAAGLNSLFTGNVSICFSDYRDISTYDPRLIKAFPPATGPQNPSINQTLYVPMTYIDISVKDEAKANEMLKNLGLEQNKAFWNAPGFDLIIYASVKNGHLLLTNDYFAADTLSMNGKLSGKLPVQILKGATAAPLYGWMQLDEDVLGKKISAFTVLRDDNYVGPILFFTHPFSEFQFETTTTGSSVQMNVSGMEGNSLYRLLSYYGTL